MGEYLMEKLRGLQNKYKIIGDVRGKGLMCAVELVANRETKQPLAPEFCKQVGAMCQEEGAMVRVGSTGVIIMSPPLVINKEELDVIVDALDKSLEKVSD